jgi:hypothetical protein
MERLNSEGIPRHTLRFALRSRLTVMTARRINACLLCRRIGVNESGLCDVCFAMLEDPEEQTLANSWLIGKGP